MSVLETLRYIVDTQNKGETFSTVRCEDLKKLLAVVEAADLLEACARLTPSERVVSLQDAVAHYSKLRRNLYQGEQE